MAIYEHDVTALVKQKKKPANGERYCYTRMSMILQWLPVAASCAKTCSAPYRAIVQN